MVWIHAYGREIFSALKSSFQKCGGHANLHRWTNSIPPVMHKLSASQVAQIPIRHIQLFCVALPAPCSYSSSLKYASRILSRQTNCRHTLWQRQSAYKGLVLSSTKAFSTSHWLSAAQRNDLKSSNKTGLIYIIAIFIFMLGGAYAGVPLYKVFCQATGRGGQAVKGHDTSKIETMEKVERPIVVRFNADVASSMRWNFKPLQTEVTVYPGETALAFYTAKNPTDKPIIGISTYNILPYEAGQYFNKIQCFCFEEQRLNPHEQVDMPVFFYIDPEFDEDPYLQNVDSITLSYTFFEALDGLQLPLPGYHQPHNTPVVAAS
ncbi:unnamed protein product [Candidula unifasciata]|uniref:Cytochrome c oxidase assembly protein COX11, mitochondrial n=1 Tax=Candidula unifasciata TaxID=100452 RepID=A0A8S3YK00_9EUPU|nr:unnamed protein product [Candidula unifasciata]